MNLIIGSHVSFKKDTQLFGSVREALSYGSNTFMFYTGAPQNTVRFPINEVLRKQAIELMIQNNIDINNVIVHAPYIVNLANSKNQDFAVSFMKEEIKRCYALGITKIVLHPGSHVGITVEEGIKNVIDSLNRIIDPSIPVSICIETMAGKGNEVGKTFDEIRTIIKGVEHNDLLKVCLDTCHLNDAGYDITKFNDLLDEFDQKIGLFKIACMHINDSKNSISSHKDRHENIGFGSLGFDNLLNIIYNEKLVSVPKILETPYISKDGVSYPPYRYEIAMIKEKKFNSNLIDDVITESGF